MTTARTLDMRSARTIGGLAECNCPDIMMARRLARLVGQCPLNHQLLIRLPDQMAVHMGVLESWKEVQLYEAEMTMDEGRELLTLWPLERLCDGERTD